MPSSLDASNIVLIASADATAAALIGGLVETMGYTVAFAAVDEVADPSRRRIRPRIYMIDCATTAGCSDEVIERAIMRGVGVVLMGPAALLARMRELATRHDLEILFVPAEPGPLGDALDRAARKSG